jgi:hypothetical protein
MPYTNQMTIAQWIQNLTNDSIGITQSINSAYTHVQKWNALYGGQTPTQLLALPVFSGMTVTDITNMQNILSAITNMYNALNGIPSGTNNYQFFEVFM